MMPAETHTTHEGIDARDVLDLIDALVGADDASLGPDTPLVDVGLGDDLAVLHIWGAVAEEFAERSVADLDVEELLLARTVGDLADAIMRVMDPQDAPDSSRAR